MVLFAEVLSAVTLSLLLLISPALMSVNLFPQARQACSFCCGKLLTRPLNFPWRARTACRGGEFAVLGSVPTAGVAIAAAAAAAAAAATAARNRTRGSCALILLFLMLPLLLALLLPHLLARLLPLLLAL